MLFSLITTSLQAAPISSSIPLLAVSKASRISVEKAAKIPQAFHISIYTE
jgi:hypothetical protein